MAENTDLPFNQIKKSEITLINPNTSIFIIGNGFDLMHNVPSSYYNFRDFLGKNNRLRNVLENYIKRDDLWADFEESLAYLDDDAMLGTTNDMMDIFDVKDQFDDDFSAADFLRWLRLLLNLLKQLWGSCRDNLRNTQTEYDLRETAGYGLIEYYDATTKKSDDVIKDKKV